VTDVSPVCGLPIGTPILTPTGHVPVEALEPGAMVLAISGSSAPFQLVTAVRRLEWSGSLIRLRAESLDDGAPQEDLLVPPDQALLIDGRLVAAGALVDGHGIVAEPHVGPIPLIQVMLGGHDAILACGAAVETPRPHPDAPDCAPRQPPDGTLRAMLSWRAEHMGWAGGMMAEIEPEIGTLRERLAANPLSEAAPLVPRLRDPDRD
jgi:hypothetical protein